jgi:hypothetical protein
MFHRRVIQVSRARNPSPHAEVDRVANLHKAESLEPDADSCGDVSAKLPVPPVRCPADIALERQLVSNLPEPHDDPCSSNPPSMH